MSRLVEWLQSIGCYDVEAVQITLHGSTFEAARYRQDLENTPPGCPAYHRGERTYTVEAIYALGVLPILHWRNKVAYTVEGDDREWYVAGYWPAANWPRSTRQTHEGGEPNEYHPLGHNFMLRPWSVPDGTSIDQYEEHPYRRTPLSIESVNIAAQPAI